MFFEFSHLKMINGHNFDLIKCVNRVITQRILSVFAVLHNVIFCFTSVKTNAPVTYFYGTCDVIVD